ncbi:class IV adenylate cyclase [Halarchaeum sp. CBA1220]|uniref:class IV adenylate cyclase n=1 Tax=Halarchaeum sp. CBA1220 TaxID=1853682 RepID=UPI000F3A7F59|nr:class IV adenylate cyclase [Halarchaeum sp. CBA1220]QLC32663.1 class IV adenylate cyclase [Halarchaeum sp. CBA1220]
MYEVEVKVPADHGDVRDALESVGAAERGTVEQADTYYDAPHRDFAETDEALRVRRVREAGAEDADARITYKGPKVDSESKAREEIETGVADGADAGALFEALGFAPAATVRKTRTYYDYEEYTVVLDDVEGLGQFVEVERESEDVASAREGAFDVLRRLGLDPDDQIRTSYLGLLLE